jgi:hypothetical protein
MTSNTNNHEDTQEYYHKTPDGYLLSTVWIKPSDAANMPWLTSVKPPERPEPVIEEITDESMLENFKDWAKINIKNKILIKNYLPIEVNGITIDADQKSQENINKKINEVTFLKNSGVEIPQSELIWKDKNNTVHQFSSADEYLTWLLTISSELSKRNTQLYQDYWNKKVLIDNCTALSDVENIFNNI